MIKLLTFCLSLVLLILNSVIAQPADVKSGFIEVPDGQLYYESAGQGDETIVLVHDGVVHSAVWESQFKVFAEKYQVVRYDRRGYGRSSRPEKKYSNIEDLNQVFTALKIDKAILIGMSAGGNLVMDFTIHYPVKVSAIVLVGAVVGGFTYSDHLITRGGRLTRADYNDRGKLLKYIILEDPYEIAPQNKEVREKVWQLMQNFRHNVDINRGRLEIIPKRKAIDGIRDIQAPALVVLGEFDIPDVFVHAGVIEYAIPNARRVIISGAGHLVPLEQPQDFNMQVLNFIFSADFNKALDEKRLFEAVTIFNEKRQLDNTWIPFSENDMNVMGYRYLQEGKTKEAIELFKLNVSAYPESANTYDSLGEAYMINGDKELAIQNYEKSLELNPENQNAKVKLEELK